MARYLLTGATGYVGRHLAQMLTSEGHEVHALVRPTSNTTALRHAAPNIALHLYDGSYDAVARLSDSGPFKAIGHLAALPKLSIAGSEIADLMDVSVALPAFLMEAASAGLAERVVMAGSFSEWIDGAGSAPNSLYGAAKASARGAADYFAAVRDLRVCDLVLHDVYGPADARGKIFGLLLQAARDGAVLDMTPGEQLIAPVHVRDVCRAFAHAFELDAGAFPRARCGVFCVPGPGTISVKEAVEIFRRATGLNVRVRWGGRPYPQGQIFSPVVAPVLPGWTAATQLVDGLRELVGGPTGD